MNRVGSQARAFIRTGWGRLPFELTLRGWGGVSLEDDVTNASGGAGLQLISSSAQHCSLIPPCPVLCPVFGGGSSGRASPKGRTCSLLTDVGLAHG